MQTNCGILSFDRLVGNLNGRTNLVSLNTLAKMAQDNKFILYPMKVPSSEIAKLKYPFILHYGNHFETWLSPTDVNPDVPNQDRYYVLSHQLNPDWIISEEESKGVRGSKKEIKKVGRVVLGKSGREWYRAPKKYVRDVGEKVIGKPGREIYRQPKHWWQDVGPNILSAGMGMMAGPVFGPVGGALGALTITDPKERNRLLRQAGYTAGATAIIGGIGGLAGGAGMTPGITGMSAGQTAGSMALPGATYPATTVPMAAFSGMGGTTAALPAAGAGGAGLAGVGKGALGWAGKNWDKLLGAGMLASSLLPKQPEPPSWEDIEGEGGPQEWGGFRTEAGQLAHDELAHILGSEFGSVYPAGEDPYLEALLRRSGEAADKEKERITKEYNAYGRLYSSEHMEALAQVDENLSQRETDVAAQWAELQRTQEINTRLTAISQALQVDSNIAAELMGYTQMSAEMAAMKYGADVADINSLRQLLTWGGISLLTG